MANFGNFGFIPQSTTELPKFSFGSISHDSVIDDGGVDATVVDATLFPILGSNSESAKVNLSITALIDSSWNVTTDIPFLVCF
jgi:hypothetical protein